MNKVHFMSKKDDWETPDDLYHQLNEEFDFTLDPAANDQNHKTSLYYTIETNGLAQDWPPHTAFLNPPYGRVITQWVKKSYHESLLGATVVMLLPARTDTKWFHNYIITSPESTHRAAEVRFLKGRLKFKGALNSAPFPSMIVIFRPPQRKMTTKVSTF